MHVASCYAPRKEMRTRIEHTLDHGPGSELQEYEREAGDDQIEQQLAAGSQSHLGTIHF